MTIMILASNALTPTCKNLKKLARHFFFYGLSLIACFTLTVPSTIAQTSTSQPTSKTKKVAAQSDNDASAKTTTPKKITNKSIAESVAKNDAKTKTTKNKKDTTTEKNTKTISKKISPTKTKNQTVTTPSTKINARTKSTALKTIAPAAEAAPYVTPQQITSQQANNYQNEGFVNEFQQFVETKIAPRVPGVAVAVIADGRVKVLQAYGVKKARGNDPIDINTLFRLASVSKTIGSSAGAMLVRDGLASWDTKITAVLPNVEFKDSRYGDQLTIRNILSQSTGLPTHTNDNFIEDGLPFDEVVRRLRYINFVCPPGKCYAYQNVTYSLISNIIQKKTGKSYEDYVQEKLFTPLGMQTASFGMYGLKARNNYALPHVMTRSGWYTETITENYYRINPAAGANASITDMSHWVLAHMGHNPDVLTPSILRTLHDKVTKNTPSQSHYGAREGVTDTHYGLGWRIFDYRGDHNFVHHGGYVLGYRSEMVFNPELQIGMVILSNSNKLSGDVIFKFLDYYEDEKRGIRK